MYLTNSRVVRSLSSINMHTIINSTGRGSHNQYPMRVRAHTAFSLPGRGSSARIVALVYRYDGTPLDMDRALPDVEAEHTTKTANGELIPVLLRAQKKCLFGQVLGVVGNVPELGSWDTQKSVAMTWTPNDTWVTTVLLPRDAEVEFKYVVMADGGTFLGWRDDITGTGANCKIHMAGGHMKVADMKGTHAEVLTDIPEAYAPYLHFQLPVLDGSPTMTRVNSPKVQMVDDVGAICGGSGFGDVPIEPSAVGAVGEQLHVVEDIAVDPVLLTQHEDVALGARAAVGSVAELAHLPPSLRHAESQTLGVTESTEDNLTVQGLKVLQEMGKGHGQGEARSQVMSTSAGGLTDLGNRSDATRRGVEEVERVIREALIEREQGR